MRKLKLALMILSLALILLVPASLQWASAQSPPISSFPLPDEEGNSYLLFSRIPIPPEEVAPEAALDFYFSQAREAEARLASLLGSLKLQGMVQDFQPTEEAQAIKVWCNPDGLEFLLQQPEVARVTGFSPEGLVEAQQTSHEEAAAVMSRAAPDQASRLKGKVGSATPATTTPTPTTVPPTTVPPTPVPPLVPSIFVHETWDNVYGWTNPGVDVTVVLKDSAGAVIDTIHTTSDSYGYYYVYSDTIAKRGIVPGDVVEVTAVGNTVSTVVAALVASIDAESNTIHGTAPPDSPLSVELSHWDYGTVQRSWYKQRASSDAAGNYSVDFGVDIMRRDDSVVRCFDANGNATIIWRHAAYLCLDKDYGSGRGYVATPGAGVTAVLKDSLGNVQDSYTQNAQRDGWYWFGFKMSPADTDTVEVTSEGLTLTLKCGPFTTRVDKAANTVSGIARGGDRWVWAELIHFNQEKGGWIWYARSARSGNVSPYLYTLDFSSIVDIVSGDEAYTYYVNGEGNELYLRRAAPVVNVVAATAKAETTYIWGYTESNVPVNISVKNATGASKASGTTTSSPRDGYFSCYLYNVGRVVQLAMRDRVEVRVPTETTVVLMPVLTANLNTGDDRVGGAAPPNSYLMVDAFHFPDPEGYWAWGYGQMVRSNAAGIYSASFAGWTDLVKGDYARVSYINPDYHRVTVSAYTTTPELRIVYLRRDFEAETQQVIVWNISDGFHAGSTWFGWDISSHPNDDRYPQSSGWWRVTGDCPGVLVAPPSGMVYFRVFAEIDGQRLVLDERSIPVMPGKPMR